MITYTKVSAQFQVYASCKAINGRFYSEAMMLSQTKWRTTVSRKCRMRSPQGTNRDVRED